MVAIGHAYLRNGGALKERRRRRAEKRSSETRKWTAKLALLILKF